MRKVALIFTLAIAFFASSPAFAQASSPSLSDASGVDAARVAVMSLGAIGGYLVASAANEFVVTPVVGTITGMTGLETLAVTATAHSLLNLFVGAFGTIGGAMVADHWYAHK